MGKKIWGGHDPGQTKLFEFSATLTNLGSSFRGEVRVNGSPIDLFLEAPNSNVWSEVPIHTYLDLAQGDVVTIAIDGQGQTASLGYVNAQLASVNAITVVPTPLAFGGGAIALALLAGSRSSRNSRWLRSRV